MFFDQRPYPPGERDKGDYFGRQLPPLPNKAKLPSKTYAINNTFLLSRPGPPELIKVTIVKPIQNGYSMLAQSLVVKTEGGLPNLNGKHVFIKVYDPLYINPDQIPNPPQHNVSPSLTSQKESRPSNDKGLSPPGSSTSTDLEDLMEGTTLAGSAQFERKNLSKLPPSAMRSHVYSHTHYI